MQIGILGAGGIGSAFARQVIKAGHGVILSNSRGSDSLAGLVAELGPRAVAGSQAQAAQADIVVLAVRWDQIPGALRELPDWSGRILIDTTNPILLPDFRVADLQGHTSSEIVASLARGARVVKTANTLTPELLAANPRLGDGRRVLFMSGDDENAKQQVAQLLDTMGFAAVDLGDLASGGKLQQFPGGPLPGLNLIKLPG